MAARFRPDPAGIREMLRSAEVSSLIRDLCDDVADGAQHTTHNGDELPVEVGLVYTDRAHGTVTLAHPAGLNVEVKYGVLERAAAAAGLEVNAG